MKALYVKYIEESSDHELNISHETRNFLHAALNGTQKHESFYFNVFDFCGAEIMKLLIRTFRRFRTTGLYNAYLDHVVLKEKEVLQDLEAQNISKQPIVIEGEVEDESNSKEKTNHEIVEKLEAVTTSHSKRNLIAKNRRKSLVPKFYAGSKHEQVLAKYMHRVM